MADQTHSASDDPRFEGDRIHDNRQQPGTLSEGNQPARPPAGRDDAVVDAEFSGLDNDLVDMGQFGDLTADAGQEGQPTAEPGLPRQADDPAGEDRRTDPDEAPEKPFG